MPASVFVVPYTVPLDGTHFHALAGNAMSAAGNGGTITIEPGVQPDPGPVSVFQTGVLIQGDPNIPGDILPSYDLNITAPGVHLLNLHLGAVTIAAGYSGMTVQRSLVNSITETTAASGDGNNSITQDRITGSVSLSGNTGGTATNDVVTFNTFTGTAVRLLDVTNDTGLLIQSNTFVGEGDGQTAINLGNSGTAAAPVVIANNSITMSVGSNGRIGIGLNGFTPTFVRVLNNTINTSSLGTGLFLNGTNSQDNLQAIVQGNDFHGNAVGVLYQGTATGRATINADLGGGALGSLGGNDFRGFTVLGNSNVAAIWLLNTPATATLTARNNIFGAAPNLVIDDSVSGAATGTGVIDVSAPLSAGRAFVQALYNDALGRSGTLAELDGWLAIPNVNQAVIVNGILRSREALGRVVDGYYLQYLGRQSDAGREGWINLLQSGVSAENVQAAFLSSPEFLGHIDTDYVQALYRLTLGRTGDAAELAGWYTVLPQLGLQGVAAAFTNSAEHRSQVVAGDFLTLLHRPASAAELSSLAGLPLDLLTLEAAVLSGPEFFANG